MNVIIAIFSTIFSSLSDVFFKKSLKFKVNLWNNDFLWQILPLFVFLVFYFWVWFSFNTKINLDLNIIWYIFLSFIFYSIWRYFHAKIYKVEKITHLLPYENLSKIFTVIFSFFLFWDVSIITLSVVIFTIFLIMFFTIDFRNLKFSKNILIFSFSHILFAIWNLIMWYVLLDSVKWWLWVSWFSFIVTYLVIWVLLFNIPFLYFKWFRELKNIDKTFYFYRWVSWFLSWFSWFLSMVIVSEFWLSISILLSFLVLITTIIFALIFLNDKPEKKDLYLSFFVVILIAIWFYFK